MAKTPIQKAIASPAHVEMHRDVSTTEMATKQSPLTITMRMSAHAEQVNGALRHESAERSDEFPFSSRWNVNSYATDNGPPMVGRMGREASRGSLTLRRILADRTA